jgi:uncharacterized protein (TIGR03435 family)
MLNPSVLRFVPALLALCAFNGFVAAQSPALSEFDVVSIKRNTDGPGAGGGIRRMPDGTFIVRNQPIASIILTASPVPTFEYEGLPDWAKFENYDLTAKPPSDSTAEQRGQMWRALFADRMKLVAHIEQRERNTFALVVARKDGKLGPELKPSNLNCDAGRGDGTKPPPTAEPQNRCGIALSRNSLVSGGITMDQLALPLKGIAGGLVNNRTGLAGLYSVNLKFTRPRDLGAGADSSSDDAPGIFTALQEQLGLKLQPEKTVVPVFVIDHIERPTEN